MIEFAIFVSVATVLTVSMFFARQMLLGFPSAIFWFLAGAASYQLRTVWNDMWGTTSLASFLLGIGIALAAYTFRKQKGVETAEGDDEEEETTYIDEGGRERTARVRKPRKTPKQEEREEDKARWRRANELLEVDDGAKTRDDEEPERAYNRPAARSPAARSSGKSSSRWGAFK